MGFLTTGERSYVNWMKDQRILKLYTADDLRNITRNGGVAIRCGDGDKDDRNYHEQTVTIRPHAQEHFGGVLILSDIFRGYNEAYAAGAIENMRWGMEAKDTESVFLYPHYPCGVATKFDHSIEEVFLMAAQVHMLFIGELGFLPKKTHSFFHVKRLNKGACEEQNTYIFDVQRYMSLIGTKIVSLAQVYHIPSLAA